VDVTDSHHGGMIATDVLGHVIFSDGVFHRSQFETPDGVLRGIDSTTYSSGSEHRPCRNGVAGLNSQSLEDDI